MDGSSVTTASKRHDRTSPESKMAVNLFSDTQTVPTPAMLRAMIEAKVGDEQRGTDPTVIALEARVAALLGHEAAVFLPSGTMCNAIAVRLHVRPGGDEIILHAFAHAAESECGSPAALSGASLRFLQTPTGIYGPERGGGSDPAGKPLHTALAPADRRADHQSRRRARLACRDDRRGRRDSACLRPPRAPRRGPADERASSPRQSRPPGSPQASIPPGWTSPKGWAAPSGPYWSVHGS